MVDLVVQHMVHMVAEIFALTNVISIWPVEYDGQQSLQHVGLCLHASVFKQINPFSYSTWLRS